MRNIRCIFIILCAAFLSIQPQAIADSGNDPNMDRLRRLVIDGDLSNGQKTEKPVQSETEQKATDPNMDRLRRVVIDGDLSK